MRATDRDDGGRRVRQAAITIAVLWVSACAPAPVATSDATAACARAWFCDSFEDDTVGELPSAPWQEETYRSGAVIEVTRDRAFTGTQSLRVYTPKGAPRRGYVAIHSAPVFPAADHEMYGRAMIWLDAAPQSLTDSTVHWTLLQGEGRSADDRYNSIYRLGAELQGALGLKANFETTPPVRTDCRQHSASTLPTNQWTCVEWHMSVAKNEMQFWLDGRELSDIHIRERGAAADSHCAHQEDLQGRWLAPPRFQSLYIGLERYEDTVNDQHLWIDDVAVSDGRVGCPVQKK